MMRKHGKIIGRGYVIRESNPSRDMRQALKRVRDDWLRKTGKPLPNQISHEEKRASEEADDDDVEEE
eukprot:7402049-Pyramimonas_sp.AAC.1